jgi:Dyp-type peroxidase family
MADMKETDREGDYTDKIQGNILRGFHFRHVRFLLVGFLSASAGRQWLKDLLAGITDGSAWAKGAAPVKAETIAFTHRGLAALEVAPEILAEFPADFRTGMRGRRTETGDSNDETLWDEIFRKDSIHALVSLYGNDETALDARVEELRTDTVKQLYVQPAERLDHEHFGFRDGISQPIHHDDVTGNWKSDVPIGEFLIFRSRWNDGKSRQGDKGFQLGELGTYLVYRKLEQRVDAFLRFVQWWPVPPDFVAAKLVGRWPNGLPVTADYVDPAQRQQPNDDNGFTFLDDPDGHKCPIGAHISRVNPRRRLPATAGKHRILRRGVPYGEAVDLENYAKDPAKVDAKERGLVFVALNASIEKQFEFVQKNWVNAPKFNGLDGVDPLANSGDGARGEFRFERDGPSRTLTEDLVRLRGGDYFFVPSMQALELLAEGKFITP